MSEEEQIPPTQPSVRPSNDDHRTPSARRLAAHEDAIAELREETGRHAKQLLAHTNELDDLRSTDARHDSHLERIQKTTDDFSKLAGEMKQEMQANNELQRSVLLEQREANALQRRSNRLKRRQEAELKAGVRDIIRAVRSPRVLGAITIGGAAAGFVIAIIEWIAK